MPGDVCGGVCGDVFSDRRFRNQTSTRAPSAGGAMRGTTVEGTTVSTASPPVPAASPPAPAASPPVVASALIARHLLEQPAQWHAQQSIVILIQHGPTQGYVYSPAVSWAVGRITMFPPSKPTNISVKCNCIGHGASCGKVWPIKRSPPAIRIQEWLLQGFHSTAHDHKIALSALPMV